MVNNCVTCKNAIKRGSPGLLCAGECGNIFHATCVNVTKNTLDTISSQNLDWFNWFCPSCKTTKRRSIITMDLPSPSLSIPSNFNATSAASTKNINTMDSIKAFMVTIQADINEFKKQQAEMLLSVEFISQSYEIIKNKLVNMENKCNKIDDIAKENVKLKKVIEDQAIRITALEQAPLMKCIEISGVPDSIKLTPIEIFETISDAIDFDVHLNEIEYCSKAKYAAKNNKPKNITVCFKDQLKKDSFLSKKKNSKLNTSIFNVTKNDANGDKIINTTNSNIFINESLCSTTKKILFETKAFAKANNYKFVWVRDGTVFLRKSENERYFKIKSLNDLNQFISSTISTN